MALDAGNFPSHNGLATLRPARHMTDRTPIRLLLVEDNPGDARLVHEHLADVEGGRSWTLADAPTLAAAVAKVRDGLNPDIVLLDLSLPDSFGLETLARWQAAAPTLPVIVLTGSDDEALAVAAVREGAQDYLVKGRIDGAPAHPGRSVTPSNASTSR